MNNFIENKCNCTGKTECKNMSCEKLDYAKIKEEFVNANKEFPLKDEECKGLSQEERLIINPCGTYCGNCDDYGVVCDGCRNRDGKPLWYALYSKEKACNYFTCCAEKKYHDCSQCKQIPCSKFFEYPDPNMSDEFKQYWFKLRMENFNELSPNLRLEIKDTFKGNEEMYNMFFKEIETDRLILKNISIEDREFILRQFSNDTVNEFLYDEEPMTSINEADELIGFYTVAEPRAQHRWILVRKQDGASMGTCGFHCWDREKGYCEIGYDLYPDYWGKGYMNEALTAIISFAKDNMKLKRIDAHIAVNNHRSIHTAEKIGFIFNNETINYNFRGKDYLHRIYVRYLF